MGQKILPTSLRLYKNKNWNSKWIVNKTIYSKFFYLDSEIKNYIFHLFKKNKTIKILKTNLKIFSKNVYVYIYIQQLPISFYNLEVLKLMNYLFLFLNKNYKIKIFVIPIKGNSYFNSLVRKSYKILQKNNQYINYKLKQIFYTLLFFFITKNIKIISNFIFLNLQKKKYQKKQFNFINRFFLIFFKLFKNFKGYRIQLKGRINNKKRSQKIKYQKGKIPLNTLKYTIHFDSIPIITSSGLCNFKIWIFLTEKQTKKKIDLKKLNQQNNLQNLLKFLKKNIQKNKITKTKIQK